MCLDVSIMYLIVVTILAELARIENFPVGTQHIGSDHDRLLCPLPGIHSANLSAQETIRPCHSLYSRRIIV